MAVAARAGVKKRLWPAASQERERVKERVTRRGLQGLRDSKVVAGR
jgi:hypothetical protein